MPRKHSPIAATQVTIIIRHEFRSIFPPDTGCAILFFKACEVGTEFFLFVQ